MSQVVEFFEGATGATPAGVWRAPGRLNVIGEHTDYSEGLALPIALSLGTSVAVGRRSDDRLSIRSQQRPGECVCVSLTDLHPMIVSGWARYPAGVLWAFRDAGWKVAGLDLVVDSDIPLGAGLASSAALTCAVAIACRDLFEFELPPRALAALAQRAESEFAGAPVGILDPMASLLCEPECALLLDARTLAVEQVPLGLAEVGLTLLVIDTREPHRLDDSAYADRRGACEAAARALHLRSLRDLNPGELDEAMKRLGDPVLARRVRHVVSENARVMEAASFLRAGDAEGIGALLSASHDSLRDDFEVSSAALDAAVAGAARGGAHGARLSGAGFGGSALALVAIDRVASVVIAVAEEFQAQGLAEPHVFEVAPAGGARRLT